MNAGTLAYLLDTGWIVRHLRGQRAYTESIASRASEGLAVSVTATQHGLTLLTTDVDDFSRFDGLTLVTAP